MGTTRILGKTRAPGAVDDSINGSVDQSTCSYSLYGTSRARNFIFSVR
jgi:hypothetical protein